MIISNVLYYIIIYNIIITIQINIKLINYHYNYYSI